MYNGLNKNHSIRVGNRCFFTAQVVDAYDRKTYDMTVIFEDFDDDRSPDVVNYYYGVPDMATTMEYINEYIKHGSHLPDFLVNSKNPL